MAAITIIGIIQNVHYLPESVIVFVGEYKRGFKKKDGTTVDDRVLSWKTVWKPYFKKYINDHFTNGMAVEIHGEVVPYGVEKGEIVEGYSIMGKSIDLFSYPRRSLHLERRAIKDSQMADTYTPDLNGYNAEDF